VAKPAPPRTAIVALVWLYGAWDKQAVISLGADGRYDLDACRLAYLKHQRARRSAKAESYTEFRKLKNRKLQIEIAELELHFVPHTAVVVSGCCGFRRATFLSTQRAW
jgi:hypothetical protein